MVAMETCFLEKIRRNDSMRFHLFLWWISYWYNKPNCIWKRICKSSLWKMKTISSLLKDVHAHCYCAFLVRTLYMTWRVSHHVFQARAPSRNSTKYRADDFWSANIFVGCSVTPTFFSADHFLFWFFPLYQKTKKICTWEVLIISHILFK